jgi:hypothetical protein
MEIAGEIVATNGLTNGIGSNFGRVGPGAAALCDRFGLRW